MSMLEAKTISVQRGGRQILYDVSDRVATITLHRPEKLNAFTGTMMREMIAAAGLKVPRVPR